MIEAQQYLMTAFKKPERVGEGLGKHVRLFDNVFAEMLFDLWGLCFDNRQHL